MKLLSAISKADEMRPNSIAQLRKAEILMTLEAQIAETMGEDVPTVSYTESGGTIVITDTDLLMADPYSECYPFFLAAQIDLINQDSELYENDRLVADDYIARALSWYRRKNAPTGSVYWKGF